MPGLLVWQQQRDSHIVAERGGTYGDGKQTVDIVGKVGRYFWDGDAAVKLAIQCKISQILSKER